MYNVLSIEGQIAEKILKVNQSIFIYAHENLNVWNAPNVRK